jgi:putative redox protein
MLPYSLLHHFKRRPSIMSGYGVQIRMAEPNSRAADPRGVIFTHHRAGHVQVKIEALTGGHLLHLAVAGCLFNDILRAAAERGVAVSQLEVSADGEFGGEPTVSTGITYSVRITGDVAPEDLRRLIHECEQDTAIGQTLQRGTRVRAAAIQVHGVT